MHPLEPHAPPTSLGGFLRAYAMIVLSILTALALERAVVAWNDHTTAAATSERIEQELSANRHELDTAIAANQRALQIGAAALAAIIAQLKAPKPDQAALSHTMQTAFAHSVGFDLPTWRQNAWDAAIADQSASHLSSANLRRYAEVYATAHNIITLDNLFLTGTIFDDIARLQLSFSLNQADGRQAALLLLRYQLTIQQLINSQKDLRATLTPTNPPDPTIANAHP